MSAFAFGVKGFPLTQRPFFEERKKWVSAYFVKTTKAYSTMNFNSGTLMLEGFSWIGDGMGIDNLEQQIAKQEERLKQLKAQKQAVLAREKKKVAEQQRKDDTRRKILLGSFLLKQISNDDSEKQRIMSQLNQYLTENRDRQLFDLPLIEEKKNETAL